MNKRDCIASVQQMGASEKQAKELVKELLNQKKRLGDTGDLTPQNLAFAWEKTSEAMRRAALAQERRTMQAMLKFKEMQVRIDAIKAQGFSAMDAIQANLVGISKRFDGARDSISAQRQGILDSWTAPMMRDLEAVDDGMALKLIQSDKSYHDDVMREMRSPGSTQNKSARQVAEIFANTLERQRQALNAAGADIGKLDGWCPQTHDPEKLMAGGEAGRQKWIDFMMEHLDHERTFDGMGLVDTDLARKALSLSYDTLTLGKNPHLSGDFASGGKVSRGPSDLASKLGHERVLHFKDADSAVLYNDTYGRGNIFDAILHRMEQDARALSIMDRLGPDPDFTLQRLMEREKQAVNEDPSLSQVEKDKRLDELERADYHGMIRGGKIVNWMAELTGEANWSVCRIGARIGSFLRATQSLAKLGGATLSAVADVFIKASAIRVNSQETWPQAISKSVTQYFESYSGDKREIARQCGAFLDRVTGDMACRWDVNEGLGKRMSKLQDIMFTYSGLNWLTERGKAGYTLWLAEHIGEVSSKTLDQMDKTTRAMLEYHGIDAKRWEVMRKMVLKGEDGKTYFSPDTVDLLNDRDLAALLPADMQTFKEGGKLSKAQWYAMRKEALDKARNKLRFDSMAMMVDETKFAIIEPDDATRAIMRQGSRPGTWVGEFWRAATQFKSFPFAYMQRILGGRRWVRGEKQQGMRYGMKLGAVGDALGRDFPGFVGFVISSLAFGYAAMTAKDLAKGRTPRDPRKKETLLAAAMQSGGLGIFGDIFLGQVNRFGNSLAETAVGPIGDIIGKVGTIGGELVRGDFANAGEDAINFGINNFPMINLWYTRQALDWFLFYHIREWQSPGTLRRAERKMLKDFNQTYMYSPAQHIKRGGFGFQ